MDNKRCKFCNVLITRDMLAFRSGEEVWCIECNVQKINKPDQQPNDVEAVKPIGYYLDDDESTERLRMLFFCRDNAIRTKKDWETDSDKSFRVCDVYPQQTVTQLQEKIALITKNAEAQVKFLSTFLEQEQPKLTDTEAKLKVAEEALEKIIKQEAFVEKGVRSVNCNKCQSKQSIAQSALDTIRKEQGDADKS